LGGFWFLWFFCNLKKFQEKFLEKFLFFEKISAGLLCPGKNFAKGHRWADGQQKISVAGNHMPGPGTGVGGRALGLCLRGAADTGRSRGVWDWPVIAIIQQILVIYFAFCCSGNISFF
jgi:hypothetical protein